MISVEQLCVNFGGFDLFKNVTFIINPKDRIGLAGRNGAGKSTLMKIISQEQEPSSGAVITPRDVRVGYLPQHMMTTDGKTVMEEAVTAFEEITKLSEDIELMNNELASRDDYDSPEYHKLIQKVTDSNERFQILGGANFHADIEVALIGLGFKRTDFDRQTTEFSGGWRMRIELAKIILQKPDVLLLDEPTNHLDIESIQWLEGFLKDYPGSVVLVSHDRAFLDNITNRTIEISLGRINDYKANYTKYIELRKERREQQLAAYRNQQKMIQETEDFIERFRYKATKSVQVQSRIKQLEKIDRIEVDEVDNRSLSLRFPPAPRSGTILVEAKEVSKRFDDHLVLDKVDFELERGQKIAFVGANGEGKTTMAKMIMNQLEYEGHLKLGHNIQLGYFAQNQASMLNENISVVDTIDQVATGEIRTKIRDILGAFMFGGEDVEKKVKVLSGGERTRLAMIKLLLEPVNFLVLDEPTNHLDLQTKDILKQALLDFDGTLLIVSHDREFLNGLVDCVYEFRNKKMHQHLGGIYNFLERRKLENMRELEEQGLKKNKTTATVVKTNTDSSTETELSYEQRKDVNKQISRMQKKVSESEQSIENFEAKLADYDQQMIDDASKGADVDFLKMYEETKNELDQVMEEWEMNTLELEELIEKKTW